MTVVETYAGGSKMDVADSPSGLHPKLVALISEGVAQNTTGNVFHPKVVSLIKLILRISNDGWLVLMLLFTVGWWRGGDFWISYREGYSVLGV